jgi:hypothetical protein
VRMTYAYSAAVDLLSHRPLAHGATFGLPGWGVAIAEETQ